MSEIHVFMLIGCRECGEPSRLIGVGSPGEIRQMWDRHTTEEGRGTAARFVVSNPDHEDWPSNVVALDASSSYAYVVYRVES